MICVGATAIAREGIAAIDCRGLSTTLRKATAAEATVVSGLLRSPRLPVRRLLRLVGLLGNHRGSLSVLLHFPLNGRILGVLWIIGLGL